MKCEGTAPGGWATDHHDDLGKWRLEIADFDGTPVVLRDWTAQSAQSAQSLRAEWAELAKLGKSLLIRTLHSIGGEGRKGRKKAAGVVDGR